MAKTMIIELGDKAGTATKVKSAVKAWRLDPFNQEKAIAAAAYYATKHEENAIIVPNVQHVFGGMAKVLHIVMESDKRTLHKFWLGNPICIGVVAPNMDVFSGRLTCKEETAD